MSSTRILIVEDEVLIGLDLEARLRKLGLEVVGLAETGEEGISLAEKKCPDLVLMDIRLKGKIDGIAAAGDIQQRLGLPVVFLTAYAEEDTVMRAQATAPYGYLNKPCKECDLRTTVAMALAKHRAEERLRESERRYAATLQSIGDGIIACDGGARITMLNPVAENLTGWGSSEAQGRPVQEILRLIHEQTRLLVPCPVERALQTRCLVYLEEHTLLVARDGRHIPIQDCAAPIILNGQDPPLGAVMAFRDVSQRRQDEERLRQTQKTESLGLLVGGIAHDFNNLLTPVIGYAELIGTHLPPSSSVEPMLSAIKLSAERAAELTQQMLAYAGKGRVSIKAVDLSRQVGDMQKFLQGSVPAQVQLEFDLAVDLPTVEADPNQLHQVLVGLVANGAEALHERQGTVKISTGQVQASRDFLRSPFFDQDLPEGTYVFLRVQDNGCGMSPDVLTRIFDPFFTTKFLGRGLGLAAVQGIVRRFRGVAKVTSEVGQGSTFEVLLPAAGPARAAQAPSEAKARSASAPLILVVEDENSVRHLLETILTDAGWRIVALASADEAVQLGQELQQLDLILLDLTIPGQDGLATLKTLQKLRPQVPVVALSGQGELDQQQQMAAMQAAALVRKPFSPSHLLDVVKQALKQPPLAPPS